MDCCMKRPWSCCGERAEGDGEGEKRELRNGGSWGKAGAGLPHSKKERDQIGGYGENGQGASSDAGDDKSRLVVDT